MAKAQDAPLRVCDLCGQVDDHPRARHMLDASQALVPQALIAQLARRTDLSPATYDQAMAELLDPTSACRHHDCCAAAGCPTGTCPVIIAAAEAGGRTGDSLRTAVQLKAKAVDKAVQARVAELAGPDQVGVARQESET